MNDNEKFPEQEAPEKNTDNAFVQVGADGSPVIPDTDKSKDDPNKDKDSTTTIGHR